MKRHIGRLEAQLLAYAQMRAWTTVRTGDLRTPMRLSADQERRLFSRLARAGMIARVWRGLYLVPKHLPVGGNWSPDEGLALATLMAARGGRYQICGLNAFNRYGFDEQMPNRTYAYNNRLSGDRSIRSVQLTLIKVAAARLGATEEDASTEGGPPAIYSSRARSLVDSVYDWSRFGSLPRGYRWIRKRVRGEASPGTCLAKVHSGFLRLSKDLDFSIPTPPGSARSDRSRAIAPVKDVIAALPTRIPGLEALTALEGHNASTQYNASLGYRSLLAPRTETIAIEIGLREPTLTPPERAQVHTVLPGRVRLEKTFQPPRRNRSHQSRASQWRK